MGTPRRWWKRRQAMRRYWDAYKRGDFVAASLWASSVGNKAMSEAAMSAMLAQHGRDWGA